MEVPKTSRRIAERKKEKERNRKFNIAVSSGMHDFIYFYRHRLYFFSEPIIKCTARYAERGEVWTLWSDKAPPRLICMLTQRIVNYHSASIDKHRRWRRIYRIAGIFNRVTPVYSADRKSPRACGHPRTRYHYRFCRRRRWSQRIRNSAPGISSGARKYPMYAIAKLEIIGEIRGQKIVPSRPAQYIFCINSCLNKF